MYKAIAKQLNLNERQERQLKLELEQASWLYSDSIWKRALAHYGHSILGYLIFIMPLVLFFISIALLAEISAAI